MQTAPTDSCTSPTSAGCQLIFFRHIIKTGGSTVRQIFKELASNSTNNAWTVSLMYDKFASNTVRRTALARWIETREAERTSGRPPGPHETEPNTFLEYHVETDGGRLMAYDLRRARALATPRCRVLATTVVRQPLAWQLSFFKYLMAGRKSQVLKAATSKATAAITSRHTAPSRLPKQSGRSATPAQLLCQSAEEMAANWTRTARNAQTATLFQRPPHWSRQPPLRLNELDLVGTTERLPGFVAALLRCVGHRGSTPLVPHTNRIEAARVLGKHVNQACPHMLHMLTDTAWPNASVNVFAVAARASEEDQQLWEAVTASGASSPIWPS